MALQDQIISLDHGQGMDTKTDPKLVVPTKFRLLQDGIFTKAKQLRKRNGYDVVTLNKVGGGTISSPRMVKSYQNELVCAASGGANGMRLFSYSTTLVGWEDRGKYTSISVGKQIIANALFEGPSGTIFSTSLCNGSCVVAGNLALYSFDKSQNPGFTYGYKSNFASTGIINKTFITVIDTQTGTRLCDSLEITNALGFSKAIVLGTSTLGILYITSTNANYVAARAISASLASGVTVGTEHVIGSCSSNSSTDVQFPYAYDAVTISAGAVVAVADSLNSQVVAYQISTTGATTNALIVSQSGNITPISISQDSSSQYWIYYGKNGIDLYYTVLSSVLISVLAPTKILTIPTIDSNQPILNQVVSRNTTTNNQTVYYSTYISSEDTLSPINTCPGIFVSIYTVDVTTSSHGSSSIFIYNMNIYGKIFSSGGRNYLPCITWSFGQSTGFILDLSDALPIAKFLQEDAEGVVSLLGIATSPPWQGPERIGVRYPSFLTAPQLVTGSQYLFGCSYVDSLALSSQQSATDVSAFPVTFPVAAYLGICGITFDLADADAYQSTQAQDTMVMNGGIVMMYDGSNAVELGFSVDPLTIGVTPQTSGGAGEDGSYIYYVTYQWPDALGNLHQSAPSVGIEVVFASGSDLSVDFKIPTLNCTQKSGVKIILWRADGSTGNSIAYRVAILDNTNTGGKPYVTVKDLMLPVSITSLNGTLYTQGGAILDNIAPPPSMILWANDNRVWAIDSENNETTIEYSKTASKGTGISFSTGLLEYLIDSRNGIMTGASPMDEKTVILKKNGLGYFLGDGANDAGTGSTLTSFQFIPSDVGCTSSKSVILYPYGLLFRTLKGIYQLDRGIQLKYIGYPVEDYNSQDITSALIISNHNQLRFLTSAGSSLLFDYSMDQWSVFTNHTGYGADNWNGIYVYVRTDGSIYSENSTSFLDNTTAITVITKTAWIVLSGVQNYERVRYLLLLGDYLNGTSASHGIQIQAAYDFSSTFGTAVPYYFGAASSSGVFQYRTFFTQQKCDAISLLITELPTGQSGEYLDLTNMTFMAGFKKGPQKTSAAKSVG